MSIDIKVEVFTKDKNLYFATNEASYIIFRRLKLNMKEFLGGEDLSSFFPTSNSDYKSSRKMESHEQNIQYFENHTKNRHNYKISTSDPIFYFMEYGTGLFVESGSRRPSKGLIHAKKGSVLKFEIDGETIYTPYISGSQPVPMFRSALFKLKNLDIKRILKSMGLNYKSKITSDNETLSIEIIGLHDRHEKFGKITDSVDWISKVGSKLKSMAKLLLGK